MAIVNSIRNVLGGFGTAGLRGGAMTTTTFAGSVMTATLPALVSAINCGTARVKVSGVDAGHAITDVAVTGSDGTTTIFLGIVTNGSLVGGGVNGQGVDFAFYFQSDLNLKNFVAKADFSAGVTAATMDFEVWGQANAGGV